jgi:hypothetical protein
MADDFGWYPGKPMDANEASMQALMRKQELAMGGQAGGDQVGLSSPAAQSGMSGGMSPEMQANYNNYFKDTYGLAGGSPLTYSTTTKAPTYDVSSQAGWDKFNALGKVADYGGVTTGLKQFDPTYIGGGNETPEQLKTIAQRMGFDLSNYRLDDAGQIENTRKALENEGQNYVTLKALTGGWGGTGDAREAATTLYKNDGGTLRAVNDPTVSHAAEKGSWLAEHGPAKVAIIGAALVASAGLAGVGAAGAGAAASGGGAASGAAAGSAAGTAAGTGAAAAGTGAGLSGVSGAVASALGPQAAAIWGGLSAVEQAAVLGAIQGGVSGGLNGGGWQGVLKGAALGGLSGGAGAYGGAALSGATGMPAWASKAAVSAGLSGAGAAASGGDWKRAALGSGLASLAGTGLSGSGMNPQLAGLVAKYGSGAVTNALMGGAGGAGGAQGGSGGVGMAQGLLSGSGSTGMAGTGRWRPGGTAGSAADLAFMKAAYAPIIAEAQRKKLKEEIEEDA